MAKWQFNDKTVAEQECIPVGCIPSAAVAISQGVYLVPGCVPGPGGCTWSRGLPGPGRGTWS